MVISSSIRESLKWLVLLVKIYQVYNLPHLNLQIEQRIQRYSLFGLFVNMNNSSHPAIFFIAYTAKAHEGLEAIPADTG